VTESDLDIHLVDEQLLPPQIRMLVREIGMAETLRLLEARGGTPYRIPKHPERARVLRDMGLSSKAIERLCDAFGDHLLDVPMPTKVRNQLRDIAIRAERAAGRSGAQVARRYGLTRRRVVQISSGKDDDGRVRDLFDLDSRTLRAQSD